jgi:hypothetical protein
MNCPDVRQKADSYLSEALMTETNHEILRHLDTCPACRTEIDGRRRLRGALRGAFNRAPELQPDAEFQRRLRGRLRHVSIGAVRSRPVSPRWLALAASVLLAIGVAVVFLKSRAVVPEDALARDAAGDHRNCALKYRLVRMPVPLQEAAERFDRSYRLLLNAPPDEISTPHGVARVVERHSCAFGPRRFGHVIIQYQGRVVSLLMTAHEGKAGDGQRDASPRVIGRPADGLSVMSVDGPRHAILLVSDLEDGELARLSAAVSAPLARQLRAQGAAERHPPGGASPDLMALLSGIR